MSDSELDSKAILQQLQQATQSITSLKTMVEEQQKTIATLSTPPVSATPLTGDDRVKALEDQLKSTVDQYNKSLSQQRKEKLDKAVKDGLLARGADPSKINHAFSFIKDKVSVDKSGNMKMVDSEGIDNNLEDALDSFADSDDFHMYKAPVQSNGSGIGPLRNNSSKKSSLPSMTPRDVLPDNEFLNLIKRSMGNR